LYCCTIRDAIIFQDIMNCDTYMGFLWWTRIKRKICHAFFVHRRSDKFDSICKLRIFSDFSYSRHQTLIGIMQISFIDICSDLVMTSWIWSITSSHWSSKYENTNYFFESSKVFFNFYCVKTIRASGTNIILL